MKRMVAILLAALLALTACTALAAVDRNTVKKVQQALNDAGYNCGTPDGSAGKKTRAAIQSYRQDKGLSVSQEIDDELLQSMGLLEAPAAPEAQQPSEQPATEAQPSEQPAQEAQQPSEQSAPAGDNARLADYGVPELPADIIESLGGIPTSISALDDRYGVSALQEHYPSWSVDIVQMKHALVETGECTLPSDLPVTNDAYLVTYYGSSVVISFETKDNETIGRLKLNQKLQISESDTMLWLVYTDDPTTVLICDSDGKATLSTYTTLPIAGDERWEENITLTDENLAIRIHHYGVKESWIAIYDENGELNRVTYNDKWD